MTLPCGVHRTRVSEMRMRRARLAGRLRGGAAPSAPDRLLERALGP